MTYIYRLLLLIFHLCIHTPNVVGFLTPSSGRVSFVWKAGADTSTDEETKSLEEEIRSMRAKQIKDELKRLNISTLDVFEKEQLVQRLLEVRKNGKGIEELRASTKQSSSSSNEVVRAPLYFTNLDTSRIAAVNMEGGGISINPSDQPYATIEMEVTEGPNAPFSLRLLLDTACSGFVLRPSVIDKFNLPKLSTPVTMTGAGGTAGATGLTQISKFAIGGESFGPLPAAVQDIGALPASLDGIVGLSFISQFSCVDLDFTAGQIALYKKGAARPTPPSRPLVAHGTMDLLPQLGIYTADVWLGSRGPVKMLVDSGAANTFLNWRGVENLGISRGDSSFLERLSNPMGAMGSDNIAMELTHRIHVSSFLRLGSGKDQLPGLSLKDSKRLGIDIGDIAILESLKGQNLGGILGIDALMRCSSVRLIFDGPQKQISLYE